MKAAVYIQYGPPENVTIAERPKPVPKTNEVLVRVVASSVTSGDARLRASNFPPLFWLPARLIFGLFKPKKQVLGHEFSGVVEAIGAKVDAFSVGDAVFGTTTMLKGGAHAEYVCVPQSWKSGVIGYKPEGLSFEESAVLPIGAMTALDLLDRVPIQAGQSAMVYGASGSVGSYALQFLVDRGLEVTAVCSAANREMVKSLGAQRVLDYRGADFLNAPSSFDLIFDAVGLLPKSKTKSLSKPKAFVLSVKSMTAEKQEHLIRIKEAAEAGRLKAYISRTFSLEDIQEAHRLVDSGRKRGNIALQISEHNYEKGTDVAD